MARGNACKFVADVTYTDKNGNDVTEDSLLHRQLLNKVDIRPVANYIYAKFLLPGVSQAMENAGYRYNNQGLFSAKDVLNFLFQGQSINYLISDGTIRLLEQDKGTRESTGQLHDYTNSLDALRVADDINTAHPEAAAAVVQRGNAYNVITTPRSTNSHYNVVETRNRLKAWEAIKQALSFNGVDIDALKDQFGGILNAASSGLASYLRSIANSPNQDLHRDEIEFVLTANAQSPLVQRLLQHFSTEPDPYLAISDLINNGGNSPYLSLVNNALSQSRSLFNVIDSSFISNLRSLINTEAAQEEEHLIKDTFSTLKRKFNIDFELYDIGVGNTVKSLSQATAKAIMTLQRRIEMLKNRNADKADIKKLLRLKGILLSELKSKQYYSGMLSYIQEVHDHLKKLKEKYDLRSTTGTPLEVSLEAARIINEIDTDIAGYKDLIQDLSALLNLTIDENLGQAELDNLQELAEKTRKIMDDWNSFIKKDAEHHMTVICQSILGSTYSDNMTIENIVKMCNVPGNFGVMNWFYSFGKLSNPVMAAVGDMASIQQDKRNKILNAFNQRIRHATGKLYKHSNSEFIYEDNNHIISDYDWAKFQNARTRAESSYRRQNPTATDFEVDEAMEQWEELNTEDVVVDTVSGRTERLPKMSLYRKDYTALSNKLGRLINSFRDLLTPELEEYYDTMMQIKGEIGTLMPEYALNQYFPPQLRKDWLDAVLEKGLFSKNAAHVAKENIKGEFTLTENDTDQAQAAMLGKDNVSFAKGDFTGDLYKLVPLFFVKELRDDKMFLKDFSSGIQALASTACNWNAMTEVLDVAEFMRGYINNHALGYFKGKNSVEEMHAEKDAVITLTLSTYTSYKTLFNLLFDKTFYGINDRSNVTASKTISKITGYTSLKGLSTNLFGGAANLLVGEMQTFQMACGNAFYRAFSGWKKGPMYFSLSDYMYGLAQLIWLPIKGAASLVTAKSIPSVLMDYATRNKQSKDFLLAERFDLFNTTFLDSLHRKLKRGWRLFLHDATFILYEAGEHAIRYHSLKAMLHARKVTIDGKRKTLESAFYKSKDPLNPELLMKPNVFANRIQITDDYGNLTQQGQEYMEKFTKDLRYACQGMYGAMNNEDKGAIHLWAVGRSAMNFRQWSVAHFSERFRGLHWDKDKKEFVRGYWTSSGHYIKKALTTEETEEILSSGRVSLVKYIGNMLKNLLFFKSKFLKTYHNSTETEKLDLCRLLSAFTSYFLLFAVTAGLLGGIPVSMFGILGDEDDEKKKIKNMSSGEKFAYYQCKRLLFEAETSTPVGLVKNGLTMLQSPIPGINTVSNALYFITGLKDMNETLGSQSPNAGMNKYVRNVLKYNLPFWRDYDRLKNFPESDVMFGMFNEDRKLR